MQNQALFQPSETLQERARKIIKEDHVNERKIKTETSADKVAIKDAIKSGKEVKGAYLKDNINLSVK